MIKRTITFTVISVFALLTLVSTARADVVRPGAELENLMLQQNHKFTILDIQRAEDGYLYAGNSENNNGKHLGFTVTAVHRGPSLGIVRPQTPSVSQNPEPATMILLGTSLLAIAPLVRRRMHRHK